MSGAPSPGRTSSPAGRPPLPNPSQPSARPPDEPQFGCDPARGEGLFAARAVRLAGVAGAVLGWRPGEFWGATPGELAAVLRLFAPEGEGVSRGEIERLERMFPDG